MLDENQLKLFEYIGKPVIKYRDDNPNGVHPLGENPPIDYFNTESGLEQKVQDALDSYQKMKYSNNSFDIKLV